VPDPYEIVSYTSALREELVALQRHLWGSDSTRNSAYFEWKYEKNPYVPEPLIYLACVDGRIVGMRGFFGAHWQGGGADILGLCADDTVIVPEFRGRGVVRAVMAVALRSLAERGHEYVFNLSAGIDTFVASLALGWKSIGPMGPVARTRKTGSVRQWTAGIVRRVRVARGLWRAWKNSSAAPRMREVVNPFDVLDHGCGDDGVQVEHRPRPLEMADLLERLSHDGRIRHTRDPEYLAWRFQNPLHEYRFLFIEGRSGLEGYLVLQRRIEHIARRAHIQIVDWEAENPKVGEALIRTAAGLGTDHHLSGACG
jgi:GNAT superfamily N-acetyltransferase